MVGWGSAEKRLMARLGELIPDAEVLLKMEPEQLAGCILQIMNSRTGLERMVTIGHWEHDLFGGANPPYPSQRRGDVYRALVEA